MKNRIFVEINGNRYRLVKGRTNCNCEKCDIQKYCSSIIGSPCLSPNEYLKKVGK